MGRFLLFFSYIGTHYRGLQIQREAGEVITRFKTVQGVLEEQLQGLKPVNDVKVKTSSRTDTHVHALCNSCHVDLVHRCHPREFNPKWITSMLNYHLAKHNEKLRILNTVLVPDSFSARAEAVERSYVYRLAVVKRDVYFDPACRGLPFTAHDAELSSRVHPPFDVEKFLKAAETLSGTHNFLSFSTKNVLKTGRKITLARLGIHVQRGSGVLEEQRRDMSDIIDVWEVHFHGVSFLYRQIRRMMGAMVMVAKGRMSIVELQQHLDQPSLKNPGKIEALPGCGLILKEVRYPQHVFNYNFRAQELLAEELSHEGTSGVVPLRSLQTVPSPHSAIQASPEVSDLSTHSTVLSSNGDTKKESDCDENCKVSTDNRNDTADSVLCASGGDTAGTCVTSNDSMRRSR